MDEMKNGRRNEIEVQEHFGNMSRSILGGIQYRKAGL
jgi:hypothetical protein